jgi:uncharacterized alkaline shock family protein YloU
MSEEVTASGNSTTLESSQDGTTVIDDVVVAKIAAAAAAEVRGIHGFGSQGMGGMVSGAIGAVSDAVGGGASGAPSTSGVTVQVGHHEAIVSLNIIIDYGARIPAVVEALRTNISDRLHTLTGLTVKAVNVEVSDVYFPPQKPPQGQPSTPTTITR